MQRLQSAAPVRGRSPRIRRKPGDHPDQHPVILPRAGTTRTRRLLDGAGGQAGLDLALEDRVHDDHRQDRQGQRGEQGRPLAPGSRPTVLMFAMPWVSTHFESAPAPCMIATGSRYWFHCPTMLKIVMLIRPDLRHRHHDLEELAGVRGAVHGRRLLDLRSAAS